MLKDSFLFNRSFFRAKTAGLVAGLLLGTLLLDNILLLSCLVLVKLIAVLKAFGRRIVL